MELKPPLALEAQVARLLEHGMEISSKKDALSFLSHVNYYRFSGYALQFRDSSGQDYRAGTSFDTVKNIYYFDEALRGILRDSLDTAEAYLRTLIAHSFAMAKCTQPPYDGHYQAANFYNKALHERVLSSLKREEDRRTDSLIVQHHRAKYGDRLPIWVMVELLSFSTLSTFYSAMYFSEQTSIASACGKTPKVLKNHLHVLSILRNKCCHGGRIYNTPLHPSVMLNASYLRAHPEVRNDTLFAGVVALLRLLPTRESKVTLVDRLCRCVTKYAASIDLSCIGFPANYQQLLLFELNHLN